MDELPRDQIMRNEILKYFNGEWPLPGVNAAGAELISDTHNWKGPNPRYIMLYPKERMVAAYFKMLAHQDKKVSKYAPQWLSIQVANEGRMIKAGLITKEKGGYVALTSLLDQAYDVTWHWFKFRNEDTPDQFQSRLQTQYVYKHSRYLGVEHANTGAKPWAVLATISKDLSKRQRFFHPSPIAPNEPQQLLARRLKIMSFEEVPERYLIQTHEERAVMTHLYQINMESGEKRIVIPHGFLPGTDATYEHLIRAKFVEERTHGNIFGLTMTLTGRRAYEVTYYHHLATHQIQKF